MALFNTRRAFIFDSRGEKLGKKGFSKKDKTFKYAGGAYFCNIKESSYWEESVFPFLWKRRTYYYNIDNSYPVLMDKKAEPPISPELFNINLETKVARDLNDLAKTGLAKLLTPKNMVFAVIAIIIIFYLASGGKLTGQ